MKWNHLPVAGGIYDQHPRLLQEWSIIFAAKAEHEKEEAKKQKAQMEKSKSKPRRRR